MSRFAGGEGEVLGDECLDLSFGREKIGFGVVGRGGLEE